MQTKKQKNNGSRLSFFSFHFGFLEEKINKIKDPSSLFFLYIVFIFF